MSDNEITKISGFTEEEIQAIKSFMGFNMSDQDLRIFLHICKQTKLDPLRRQIFAIPRGGRMTIQTSIDGLRLVAERSGKYAPGKPTEFQYDDQGRLIAATAFVKKFVGDTWHEVGETAYFKEFVGRSDFWKRMPNTMLSKVAESKALRRSFPEDLSGIYTDDEMDQADVKVIDECPKKPKVDEIIDEQTYDKLVQFINGHKEIEDKLKELCKVGNLRNIKKSQLIACRSYAKKYIDKLTEK